MFPPLQKISRRRRQPSYKKSSARQATFSHWWGAADNRPPTNRGLSPPGAGRPVSKGEYPLKRCDLSEGNWPSCPDQALQITGHNYGHSQHRSASKIRQSSRPMRLAHSARTKHGAKRTRRVAQCGRVKLLTTYRMALCSAHGIPPAPAVPAGAIRLAAVHPLEPQDRRGADLRAVRPADNHPAAHHQGHRLGIRLG